MENPWLSTTPPPRLYLPWIQLASLRELRSMPNIAPPAMAQIWRAHLIGRGRSSMGPCRPHLRTALVTPGITLILYWSVLSPMAAIRPITRKCRLLAINYRPMRSGRFWISSRAVGEGKNASTSGGLPLHREILSENILSERNRYIPALSGQTIWQPFLSRIRSIRAANQAKEADVGETAYWNMRWNLDENYRDKN